MKKLSLLIPLAFLVLLMALPSSGQTPVIYTEITVTNNHAVSTNVVATNVFFRKLTVVGKKAGGVTNAATVFFGPATNTVYEIQPGTVHFLTDEQIVRINLNNWYLKTPTTGDGVMLQYR